MAYLTSARRGPDFDTWKRDVFDADPIGRAKVANGHRLYRRHREPE